MTFATAAATTPDSSGGYGFAGQEASLQRRSGPKRERSGWDDDSVHSCRQSTVKDPTSTCQSPSTKQSIPRTGSWNSSCQLSSRE